MEEMIKENVMRSKERRVIKNYIKYMKYRLNALNNIKNKRIIMTELTDLSNYTKDIFIKIAENK